MLRRRNELPTRVSKSSKQFAERKVRPTRSTDLRYLLPLNVIVLGFIFLYARESVICNESDKVVETKSVETKVVETKVVEKLAAQRPRIPLRDELIATYPKYGAGAHQYWRHLLEEGQSLNNESSLSVFQDIIEVGANNAQDAINMAKMGFRAHSFEPSPTSFNRMKSRIRQLFRNGGEAKTQSEKIFVYNYAVGDTDGGTVSFDNSGSTGAQVVTGNTAGKNVATVPTISVDKFLEGGVTPDFTIQGGNPSAETFDVAYKGEKIFAAKIDVQGFEPFVFRGMKNTIKQRRIPYIMTEWWPKGIETGGDLTAKPVNKCELAMEIMYELHNAGYVLFASPVEAHPGLTDPEGQKYTRDDKMNRRFDDLREDCLAFYALEEKFPNNQKGYMGYWTDVIAVSPDAPLPKTPVTNLGKGIQKYRSTINAR